MCKRLGPVPVRRSRYPLLLLVAVLVVVAVVVFTSPGVSTNFNLSRRHDADACFKICLDFRPVRISVVNAT